MEPVRRPGQGAQLGHAGQVHLGEDPVGLGHRGWAAVVGQGHPGCWGRTFGVDRVVRLWLADPVTEPSGILTLTASGDDRVDVHLVDGPGEPVPRGWIGGCPLGKQHDHDAGVERVVSHERHS